MMRTFNYYHNNNNSNNNNNNHKHIITKKKIIHVHWFSIKKKHFIRLVQQKKKYNFWRKKYITLKLPVPLPPSNMKTKTHSKIKQIKNVYVVCL